MVELKYNVSETDAEAAVIGSLCINPSLVGECLTKIGPEDFSNFSCMAIFQAFQALYFEGQQIDVIVVRNRLTGMPEAEKTLRECMELTPTWTNIWAYVDIVKQQARMRRVREIATQLLDAKDLDEAQRTLDSANGIFIDRQGLVCKSALGLIDDFLDRHQGEPPEYLSYGFPRLDAQLYTEPGDLILLGGKPSAGKTALALQFAWHMAKTHKVAFYSLETSDRKIGDRSMAALAGVPMDRIKRNTMDDRDRESVRFMRDKLKDRRIDVISASGSTVQDIQAHALAHRYEIIFIDYVQLLATPGVKDRISAVTSISLALHQLAQRNGITVIGLSQLKREEAGKGKKSSAPSMSDLRESGQLEQDADVVMLLYQDDPGKPNSPGRILSIAKHKEGECGFIRLYFNGLKQRFSEISGAAEPAKKKSQQVTWSELDDETDDLPF